MIPSNSKNIIAITYVLGLYGLGIGLILQQSWLPNVFGVLAITHSLIISTALTHEFIHGNIFKSRKLNEFFGKMMTHVNGACYAPWPNLVEHHFNHHLHHVDVVRFDVAKYFNHSLPGWLRSTYVVLEWLYFPIIEFEMRWRVIFDPLVDAKKRPFLGQAICWATIRTLGFGLLAWISWKALILYFVAYVSFVNLTRFVDAFHHTYEYVVPGEDFPQLDRVYEQKNTFSNLVSAKYPWLNLLFLNFGYHNAHHHNMRCPWHELPELHSKLYGKTDQCLLPLPLLVSNYRRFRLHRLLSGQGIINHDEEQLLDSFTGAVAVSLLTPP